MRHPREGRLQEPPHPHILNNGPPPPPLQNGAPHPQSIVSPIQGPAPTNGVNSAASSAIHKLTTANEQTWLLIGVFYFRLLEYFFNIVFRPRR